MKLGENKVLRLKLGNIIDVNHSILSIGYSLKEYSEYLNVSSGDFIYLVAHLKLKSEHKQSLQVFVQDKTDYWAKESIPYSGDDWQNIIVHKKIRTKISDLSMGITWRPNGFDDYLEIQSLKVYIIKAKDVFFVENEK